MRPPQSVVCARFNCSNDPPLCSHHKKKNKCNFGLIVTWAKMNMPNEFDVARRANPTAGMNKPDIKRSLFFF